MSTSDETFRATVQGKTPEGEPTTLIVTRQGGCAGRTRLTITGGDKTKVVLTAQEAEELIALLGDAPRARWPRWMRALGFRP